MQQFSGSIHFFTRDSNPGIHLNDLTQMMKVVTGLMNSKCHKIIMTSKTIKYIGVGVLKLVGYPMGRFDFVLHENKVLSRLVKSLSM